MVVRVSDSRFLDLFRGLAALWVVLAHCSLWSGAGVAPLVEPKKAVDLFLVISGFLMMLTIDRDGGEGVWRRFYLRRFLRIAPVYYLSLWAMAALCVPFSQGMTGLQGMNPALWSGAPVHLPQPADFAPGSLLMHASFIFGLVPSQAAASGLPDWSLSLEMQFYAVFPLLYLAGRRWGLGLVCGAAALAAALLVHTYGGDLSAFPEPSPLPLRLPMFLIGMLVYEGGRARRPLLFGLAAAIALPGCRMYGDHLASPTLLLVLIGAIAALWWYGTPRWLRPIVDCAPVAFLARTSYALYLFHGLAIGLLGWPVMAGLTRAGAPFALAAAAMTATVLGAAYATAWAIHRIVELPGMRRRAGSRAAALSGLEHA